MEKTTSDGLNELPNLKGAIDITDSKYAPMFYNVNDGMYYTTKYHLKATEEEAMKSGEYMAEYSKGMGGSSEFTGIVIDLTVVDSYSGVFIGFDGESFPVLIIDWERLH